MCCPCLQRQSSNILALKMLANALAFSLHIRSKLQIGTMASHLILTLRVEKQSAQL